MPKKVDPEMVKLMAAQAEVAAAYQRKEPLNPSLAPYDDGNFIRHPLISISSHFAAAANLIYREKLEQLRQSEVEGDWLSWIYLHEEPVQMDAVGRVGKLIASDSDYWAVVGDIFTSVENAFQHRAAVRRILTSRRPGREAMMHDDEREALAGLPEVVTIYRGFGKASCRLGWSWTTDPDKALWFGNRFAILDGVQAKVISGECDKGDVIAYFTRRNESEVVVDPKKVRLV